MARGRKAQQDASVLEMALVGYEIEKQKIDQKIREIRASLGGRRGKAEANSSSAPAPRRKRELSESARKRIAAAQKRRWAEHRKRLAQAAKEE